MTQSPPTPGRPFGFAADAVTLLVEEAEIVGVLVDRFLAGESLRTLADWLQLEGITTPSGALWRTKTLRALLVSARIAGLSERGGVVVGPAGWEPIISADKRDRVQAKFLEKTATSVPARQDHLLSGLLRCGVCRHELVSSARTSARSYVCLRGPGLGGCGRTTVLAADVERVVLERVRARTAGQDDAPLDAAGRHTLITGVLAQVVVQPGGTGARTFDQARLRLVWRD